MNEEPIDIQTNTPDETTPEQTNSKLHVGDRFADRYFLERCLGFGSFGQTWLAFDSVKNGNVVFKQLPPGIDDNSLDIQRITDMIESVQELHSHQYLVVQEMVRPNSAGKHVIVSNYVDGISLGDYYDNFISTFRMFPRSSVIRVLWPIAGVLDAAHNSALYHKSLKPQNILIGKVAGIKLTDFSVPTLVRSLADVKASEMSDSIAYTAPEILQGNPYTRFSDQFSLGVIAYELICGKKPFVPSVSQTISDVIIRGLFVPISTQPDDVNDTLERALAKTPEDRFPSCTEFVRILMDALLTRELYNTKKRQQHHFGTKYGFAALFLGTKKPEVPVFLTESRPEVLWPFDQGNLISHEMTEEEVENFVLDRSYAKTGQDSNMFSSVQPTGKIAAGIAAAAVVLGGVTYYCWPDRREKSEEQKQVNDITNDKITKSFGLIDLDKSTNDPNADSVLSSITDNDQSDPVIPQPGPLDDGYDYDAPELLGSDSTFQEPENYVNPQLLPVSPPKVTGLKPEPSRNVNSPKPVEPSGLSKPGDVGLRDLAKRGDTAAQVQLALDLQQGTGGFAVDESESVFWFRQAAIKHDADAMYHLGRCYETGRGVPLDDVRAMQWYQKAATKDHPQATYRAGLFYDQGRGGVRKNSAEAFRLFRKAATFGSEDAKQHLLR